MCVCVCVYEVHAHPQEEGEPGFPAGGNQTCVTQGPSYKPLPPASLTPLHSSVPFDGSLHGAVLGQWLSSKIADPDAAALRVTPLVALVAGQVQVARGGTSQGEGSLLLCLQQLPGHLQPLHLVLRAPGYCRGDKDHVLSPDPVLQS